MAIHFRLQLGCLLYLQCPSGSSRDKLISANHQATLSPSVLWAGKALEWGHCSGSTSGHSEMLVKGFPLEL